MRWVFFGLLLFAFTGLLPEPARASNAKAEVVLEIERIERLIDERRWDLNTLHEKKALEKELELLRKLYDAVIMYESSLMADPCAGATIDSEGGPPRSTEHSDTVGLLSIRSRNRGGRQGGGVAGGGGRVGARDGAGGGSLGGGGRFRFQFIRQITDVEVRLLAELVYVEHQLDTRDWGLNTSAERKALRKDKERIESALRRLRNSRC